ncbi:MAG TPA: MaoC family dehydratase [Xanthomonadales bacterium]|nr:MaoC family dehydratase [Xanthomonadales bacterium]
MSTKVTLEEFRNSAGRELAPSDWLEVNQDRVNQFADATLDHQFIHLDPERAVATPFGGTIVHGYLTLSLLVHLNSQHALEPEGMQMLINYGSDKVRFLAPVRVGSRIRSTQKVIEVSQRSATNWLVKLEVTVEIEGGSKPAMLAEVLMLYVLG